MNVGNVMADVAYAVVMACEKHLPAMSYDVRHGKTIIRRPAQGDVSVYVYPQTFGDSSLGAGGVAGQMISDTHTVVVVEGTAAAVYRSSRFDYLVQTDEEFWALLKRFALPDKVDVMKHLQPHKGA